MARKKFEQKKANNITRWVPKEGLYQCVSPNGFIHIDTYPTDRISVPVKLKKGDEVELYKSELRVLKGSELLEKGYLAPIIYYEYDDKGDVIEIEVIEDDDLNPNVVSDKVIYTVIQLIDSKEKLVDKINKIDSIITLERYKRVCVELDTPNSFVKVIEERLSALTKEVIDPKKGDVPDDRRRFLFGDEE